MRLGDGPLAERSRGMLVGLGIDVVEIARVRDELARDGDAFKRRLFTPGEIDYCDGRRYPARHYAARFAAKEALFKALGTGVRDAAAWREVEVRRGDDGAARVVLNGGTERAARSRDAARILVSLSHSREWAVASVVLES